MGYHRSANASKDNRKRGRPGVVDVRGKTDNELVKSWVEWAKPVSPRLRPKTYHVLRRDSRPLPVSRYDVLEYVQAVQGDHQVLPSSRCSRRICDVSEIRCAAARLITYVVI